MKKLILISSIACIMLLSFSCNNKNNHENMTVLTERIAYPVFIKSPYPDETDWWKENMEGQKREKFVNILLDAAFDGKVKAYDYFSDLLLTKQQVNSIMNRNDTLKSTRPFPPYDEFDTVIVQKLERKNIHRITFLEEWYFDEKNFTMEKKVVGIAPAITMYADSNEIKGYRPLFWIYLDDKYPMKNK
ncbi:MAG: hypothetical protein WCQ95_05770 [Bacteroidota bacterium]